MECSQSKIVLPYSYHTCTCIEITFYSQVQQIAATLDTSYDSKCANVTLCRRFIYLLLDMFNILYYIGGYFSVHRTLNSFFEMNEEVHGLFPYFYCHLVVLLDTYYLLIWFNNNSKHD